MRRVLSILLLLVLGFGPTATAGALASGLIFAPASGWTGKIDESRIPACCRRNGKHHCAMGTQGESAPSTSQTSVFAKDSCPCSPRALAATAPTVVGLLGPISNSSAYPSSLRVQTPTQAAAQKARLRSWPKRGPPATQTL